jgi:2-hydroxychromene-2-carboxylate isomerase
MNTVTALRMTLQLEGDDRKTLARLLFRAYWADDRDINDHEQLAQIASQAKLDGGTKLDAEALLAGCADPDVKLALRHNTERAGQLGVCGAPCFQVTPAGSDTSYLFWGQDRLDFVAKVLSGWRPACG